MPAGCGPEPEEAPTANTALVFSNLTDFELRAVCRARNAQGQPVGHAGVRIPANGVTDVPSPELKAGRGLLIHFPVVVTR